MMFKRSLSDGSLTLNQEKANYLNKTNLDERCSSSNARNKCSLNMRNWLLAEVTKKDSPRLLPLKSFNHVSREVLSLSKSLKFYCDILGFIETARPPFEVEGHWLVGYGLNLHLVLTKRKQERLNLLKKRIEHFSECLPVVDHIAFVTDDLKRIQKVLDEENVYYKYVEAKPGVDIEQIFFFDPDGNVIELSNCGPPPGMITCPIQRNNVNIMSSSNNHLVQQSSSSSSSSSSDMNDDNDKNHHHYLNNCEDTDSTKSESSLSPSPSSSSPSDDISSNIINNNPKAMSAESFSMFVF